MAKVFVSHASADKEFVDAFVDNILRIGLGMNGDNIFYSSERDTGIPSGAELIHHVRTEVSEATLVVAIITPMYQTRPVCIAELGAAWGRTDPDLFFPLLAPTMERSELQGVIPSALAQQIDDGSALDELSDRVEAALGPLASKTQWGVGKQKWLSAVRTVEKSLQRPDVPTADEHQEMVRELDEVRAALAYTANEVDEWKRKFDELEKAKDATEARRIRVGGSPLDQFHAAVTHAKSTISQLPPPVREAIYQSLRGSSVPYPNRFEDPYATDEFDDAIERRLLVEEDDNLYAPNRDKGRVAEAIEAVEQLTNAISVEKAGPDFPEWFAGEYDGLDPDLRDRDCWEELLG